jgi:hypothetical protein
MTPTQCLTCHYELTTGTKLDFTQTISSLAQKVGVGESSIRRHKEHGEQVEVAVEPKTTGYAWDVGADEFSGNSSFSEDPLTTNDVEDFIRKKGLDPKEWDYTWRFSEWEQFSKIHGLRILHAFKVTGKRKAKDTVYSIEPEVFREILDTFQYVSGKKETLSGSRILVPADLQLGKKDWNGDHKETIEQALTSFHRAAEEAERNGNSEIVIVDAGDPIENIYNVSSQRATNSLSLPSQITQAFELMLNGISILSKVAPVRYVAVPSNHGANRVAIKSMEGDVHDDWGIALADLIRTATNVPVIKPDLYHESLIFEASGSQIGVVHGHQAGGPDKIGDWWKGQSHGNMPTSQARILISGHWHSFRMYQSGDARWVFVGPSSDRGSSWFTNLKGEWSTSGMLTFQTRDNLWSDPKIV